MGCIAIQPQCLATRRSRRGARRWVRGAQKAGAERAAVGAGACGSRRRGAQAGARQQARRARQAGARREALGRGARRWAGARGAGQGRAAWACCWLTGCALGALSLFLTRFDLVLFLSQFLGIVREPGS